MSLFVVEHFIITFNPDGPQSDATKEVPNFNLYAKFPPYHFPINSLFPVEIVVVANPHSAQLMHDERGPSPSPPRLDAILHVLFNRFTGLREAKDALFRNETRCDANPPFID